MSTEKILDEIVVAVLPALPGWSLHYVLEDQTAASGKSLDEWGTPVIGWRITRTWTLPVVYEPNEKQDYALRDPNGRVYWMDSIYEDLNRAAAAVERAP